MFRNILEYLCLRIENTVVHGMSACVSGRKQWWQRISHSMKQNIEDGKIGGAAIATAENIINTGHEGTAIDCYLLQTANDCRGDANNPNSFASIIIQSKRMSSKPDEFVWASWKTREQKTIHIFWTFIWLIYIYIYILKTQWVWMLTSMPALANWIGKLASKICYTVIINIRLLLFSRQDDKQGYWTPIEEK